jgi:hypothetical protein
MTATATARNRIAAVVLAVAALGGSAAFAAAESSPVPAVHAVAMPREDPTCHVVGYLDFRGVSLVCP